MAPSTEVVDHGRITVALACDVGLAKYFNSLNPRVAQSYLDISPTMADMIVSRYLEEAAVDSETTVTGKLEEILIIAVPKTHENSDGFEGHHIDSNISDTENFGVADPLIIELPVIALKLLDTLNEPTDVATEDATFADVERQLQKSAVHTIEHASCALDAETMYAQQRFINGRKLKSLKLLGGSYVVEVAGLVALISSEFKYTPFMAIAPIVGNFVLSRRLARIEESEITLNSPVERAAIELAEDATEIPQIVTIKLGPGDYFVRRRLGNRAY